jgi:hypothetical protein
VTRTGPDVGRGAYAQATVHEVQRTCGHASDGMARLDLAQGSLHEAAQKLRHESWIVDAQVLHGIDQRPRLLPVQLP